MSGAGGTLAGAEAETTRLRFGLDGSRPFRLGGGSVLTPGMEIAVHRDGGDAETGFGAELRAHGLLTHEAQGFRQRGLAGALTWDPVAGDRGPRLSLTRTSGVPARRGPDTPLGRGTLAGLAANEPGNEYGERRLEARFGYGFPAFGGRFTSTPQIAVGLSDAGRDYSLGWRLVRDGDTPDGSALELTHRGAAARERFRLQRSARACRRRTHDIAVLGERIHDSRWCRHRTIRWALATDRGQPGEVSRGRRRFKTRRGIFASLRPSG